MVALHLYVGLDPNRPRTYREVNELMGISIERVRQLLVRPKELLARQLLKRSVTNARTAGQAGALSEIVYKQEPPKPRSRSEVSFQDATKAA